MRKHAKKPPENQIIIIYVYRFDSIRCYGRMLWSNIIHWAWNVDSRFSIDTSLKQEVIHNYAISIFVASIFICDLNVQQVNINQVK